jgi:glutathione S-transferase
MVGYGDLATVLTTLEQAVAASPFIAGESFSAADVYVGSQVIWGMQFGTLERSPVFEAYAERLRAREAYQRAQDLDGPME